MNKQEKNQEIDRITKYLTDGQVAIFADYRGMTVADVTAFRKDLRKAGGQALVVKNTLTRLALKNVYKDSPPADLEKLTQILEGPTIMAFSSSDAVEPAKIITKYAKDKEAVFKVKGAWFEDNFLDKGGVTQLSKMPSREEVLAKLLALLNTPAIQLLRVMKASAEQVVRVIDAARVKKEQGQ